MLTVGGGVADVDCMGGDGGSLMDSGGMASKASGGLVFQVSDSLKHG